MIKKLTIISCLFLLALAQPSLACEKHLAQNSEHTEEQEHTHEQEHVESEE